MWQDSPHIVTKPTHFEPRAQEVCTSPSPLLVTSNLATSSPSEMAPMTAPPPVLLPMTLALKVDQTHSSLFSSEAAEQMPFLGGPPF